MNTSVASVLSSPEPIRIGTRLKWGIFRLLERLSDLRGNTAAAGVDLEHAGRPVPALWVFVSTIGELNAIDPFLRQLTARLEDLKLVLITDHPHYRDAYLARYPAAEVCVTRGHGDDAAELARGYPPQYLVVAEIPCWPGDAPCRFSFAFVLEAKQRNAVTCIVNGWLYHYAPTCRMDAIERQLFQRDYLRSFDVMAAQTEDIRNYLIAAGAPANRIVVTGNIKFDALPTPDWSPAQARSPIMLTALLASSRPVIVAGCVTDFPEQEMILDAFGSVRVRHPEALLILAPRHPEVSERMRTLRDFVDKRDLPTLFRSNMADQPVPDSISCLVLDTIGELRDFYAAATLSHVGVDHNVLEPLGFEKPVTVRPGWEKTYPSYPVYRMLSEAGCLMETADPVELSQLWLRMLDNKESYQDMKHRIGDTIMGARGAVARHMAMLEPWLANRKRANSTDGIAA